MPEQATVDEQYVAPHERRWKRPWMSPFLQALAIVPDVTSACRYADVSRQTVYTHRERNADFSSAWDEAYEHARDLVQRTAHSWITTGVPVKRKHTKTVTKTDAKGNVIEQSTTVDETETAERSAQLMIFWLKAFYPDRFRFAEKTEVTGAEGGPVRLESVDKIDREIAELTALLEQRAVAAGSPPPPVE